jgi:endonuclease YncB( thermonuclease family)
VDREIATSKYLRFRLRRRLVGSAIFALLIASVVMARSGDDWAIYDHHSFHVIEAESGDSVRISTENGSIESVKLLGIDALDARSKEWLTHRALGANVTLLLQSPQTRDSSGRLLAFVFIDHSDLSVELTKAGWAFADRRGKTAMDGLIQPAEAEARKKKLGMWADLKFEQMPAWRQAWLRSLPARVR